MRRWPFIPADEEQPPLADLLPPPPDDDYVIPPGETRFLPLRVDPPPEMDKKSRQRLRSWLLWNIYCRRGRRCADLAADVVTVPGDPVVKLQYTCGGCRSEYRWDSLTRSRVRL